MSDDNAQMPMPGALMQVPAPPNATEIVADGGNMAHQAWLAAAGEHAAQHAWQALAFLRECCSLFVPADEASKAGDVASLQALEMRARAMLAVGKSLLGGWGVDFANLTHATVAAQWHVLRGNVLVMEWRHARGRSEYADAVAEIRRSVTLMNAVVPKLPPVYGILEAVPLFATFVNLQNASIPLMEALERQCDAELLLIQGRLGDYVAAVNGMAGELERTAEGMLASGADTPEVHAISGKLRAMSDQMLARADAVHQLRGNRPPYAAPFGDKVFIIHGHAAGEWEGLRRMLEQDLGLAGRVVVLKEEANQGQTIIEKFEAWADQCCFAFALLTPDDTVAPKKSQPGYAQARPNALFETGWFYGRFGPRRLCIVRQAGTELPSDLGGVATTDFSNGVKDCFLRIQQELRSAGVIGAA